MDSKQLRAMSIQNAHAAIQQAQSFNPTGFYSQMINAIKELETPKPRMLTITNIEKLFRKDVCGWRISRVETLPNTYIIHLRKLHGEKHQVNLERNPIGNEYELWCWKDNLVNKNNPKPERLMLERKHLETMDDAIARITLLLI